MKLALWILLGVICVCSGGCWKESLTDIGNQFLESLLGLTVFGIILLAVGSVVILSMKDTGTTRGFWDTKAGATVALVICVVCLAAVSYVSAVSIWTEADVRSSQAKTEGVEPWELDYEDLDFSMTPWYLEAATAVGHLLRNATLILLLVLYYGGAVYIRRSRWPEANRAFRVAYYTFATWLLLWGGALIFGGRR